MAANRKIQSAAVRFGPLLKAFLLCLLLGGSGIGFVWQKQQIHQLGLQIKQLETTLAGHRAANRQRADTLAYQRSPRALDARVRELNLGLMPPRPENILRLSEPSSAAVTQRAEPPSPPSGGALARK
ncbi:MAG: hypothetical protein HZA89_11390 [Verrucomicrobia bacterium]|nr:hypothetical protein [Verrucomicrobiota bacterium]